MPAPDKATGTEKWFCTDEQFDQLYPDAIQLLARRHWTPLEVARRAAGFLAAEANVRILDIGSGVGKFCLAAAHFRPAAFYFGIEQRKRLVKYAEEANDVLKISNVFFLNGNFTQVDFNSYDHFYFYNSFYENVAGTDKIDNSIDYSLELFNYYHRYLYKQLEQKPPGTRVASYHGMEDEMPTGYHIVGSEMNNLLKFWIKI